MFNVAGKYVDLAAQGCYEEWFEDRDLRNQVLMIALTPQKCMSACKEGNFAYAGVRVSDIFYMLYF